MTFAYPKNSYKLNLNLETKKLQDHQFNIGQFFSHIARNFGKSLSFLNPFQLSAFPKKTATTTTTTESNFDFGSEEVTSDTEVDVRVSTEEDLKSSSVTEGSMSTPTIKEVEIENNKYLPPTNEYLPSNIKKKYRWSQIENTLTPLHTFLSLNSRCSIHRHLFLYKQLLFRQ